jgi:Cd2+/Zn2+-exporting ATPase
LDDGGVSVAILETMEKWSSFGATVGWIGVDGNAIGIYSVGDQLRPEAPEAVKKLKVISLSHLVLAFPNLLEN